MTRSLQRQGLLSCPSPNLNLNERHGRLGLVRQHPLITSPFFMMMLVLSDHGGGTGSFTPPESRAFLLRI